MRSSLRVSMLASVIGVVLVGAAWSPDVARAGEAQTVEQRESYIVKFAEPGLLYYRGGIGELRGTAPAGEGFGVDSDSVASIAYKEYLLDTQDTYKAAMSAKIGRPVAATHEYVAAYNGVAMMLTAGEAAKLRTVPGVVEVKLAGEEHLHTYRGPSFIGADTVWNGTNVPPGLGGGSRGQGVVIAVLDSGMNSDHPSFANDASCGFNAGNPKTLSSRDCSTSAAGVCSGPTPEDTNGHGSHTASTSGGNTLTSASVPPPPLPSGFTSISGVAPCAQVRAYKVCPGATCPGADIQAGMQNAILDGVDVINFSISGGTSPWSDNDRVKLDAVNAGIFVAASAGNTRAATPDPVGAVNHLGPWVTTVAASSHDDNTVIPGLLTATGTMTPPPANTQNVRLGATSTSSGTAASNLVLRHSLANPIGCTPVPPAPPGPAFPPGFFNGAIALISRGSCTFEEKVLNAQAAGANMAILYNNVAGAFNPGLGTATLSTYTLLQAEGQAFVDYFVANAANPTTVNFAPASKQGDVLADFSLRGPSTLVSVTKPDITAPGTSILAAVADPANYGFIGGTSMSSPHIAGAAALIRSVQTAWSPTEVRSAMMLTAFRAGTRENGTTPWDADDVGSGRIDLTKAVRAGLLMNETFSNYLAANPAANPPGNPATLNLPSMRNVACGATCAWTRTMKNALTVPTTWNVTVETPAGMTLAVVPNTFSFTGQGPTTIGHLFRSSFEDAPPVETQALVITATPTAPLTSMTFARVIFTEADGRAPQSSMYVAIRTP